ncbi:MAG: transporter [Lentisphaerae bacterium]|nr:transporter [Lentisphaerota bacterium]
MTTSTIRKSVAGVLLVGMAACFQAQAAGFALYEASTKGTVMGGAVIGRATDASTVYHNPANMTKLPGTHTMVGVTVIAPSGDVGYIDSGRRYSLRSQYFTPPHAYLTYQLDERWWLGAGIYSPFGLGTDYKSGWRGSYDNSGADIRTFSFNPNLAFLVTDDLSLAIGGQVMYLDLVMQKSNFLRMVPQLQHPQLGPLVTSSKLNLKGDSYGYGWNVALAYDITDDLTFGMVYRSRVKQHVGGTAKMKGNGPLGGGTFGLPDSSSASGDVTLPDSISAGLNYKATERLNLGAIATFTHWSTYERLDMKFSSGLGRNPNTGAPLISRSRTEKDWSNVWRLGFGADYVLSGPWSMQAGYVYDECPINTANGDFLLPAGNRNLFSLGVSYDESDWTVQLGYTYLLVKTSHFSAPDTGTPVKFQNADAHMVAFSVGKKF